MPKILRTAATALSACLLVLAIAIALITIVVPKLMGAAPYTVLTGSMSPSLEPGTLVIVEPKEHIQIGDVITYQVRPGEPEVITHRVVGETVGGSQTSFITQGDANSDPDPEPVIPAQIRGTVAYAVPWMGYVNSAINRDARSTLLTGAAVLLIAYGAWQVVSEVRSRRARSGSPS